MFIETTKTKYDELSKYLKEKGISYESSNCTLPNDKEPHVHLEFGEMNEEQRDYVVQMMRTLSKQIIKDTASVEEKMLDVDNDGKADYLEDLDVETNSQNKQSHKLKRRDVTQNPVTVAKDWFFGTDEKEID